MNILGLGNSDYISSRRMVDSPTNLAIRISAVAILAFGAYTIATSSQAAFLAVLLIIFPLAIVGIVAKIALDSLGTSSNYSRSYSNNRRFVLSSSPTSYLHTPLYTNSSNGVGSGMGRPDRFDSAFSSTTAHHRPVSQSSSNGVGSGMDRPDRFDSGFSSTTAHHRPVSQDSVDRVGSGIGREDRKSSDSSSATAHHRPTSNNT